eukprot:354695-Chlamydomonas_euryale.AAC.5
MRLAQTGAHECGLQGSGLRSGNAAKQCPSQHQTRAGRLRHGQEGRQVGPTPSQQPASTLKPESITTHTPDKFTQQTPASKPTNQPIQSLTNRKTQPTNRPLDQPGHPAEFALH